MSLCVFYFRLHVQSVCVLCRFFSTVFPFDHRANTSFVSDLANHCSVEIGWFRYFVLCSPNKILPIWHIHRNIYSIVFSVRLNASFFCGRVRARKTSAMEISRYLLTSTQYTHTKERDKDTHTHTKKTCHSPAIKEMLFAHVIASMTHCSIDVYNENETLSQIYSSIFFSFTIYIHISKIHSECGGCYIFNVNICEIKHRSLDRMFKHPQT